MNAPPVPDWFHLDDRPKPVPLPPLAGSHNFSEKLKKWRREYPPLKEANRQYEEDRYFSWRWWYADEMLKSKLP